MGFFRRKKRDALSAWLCGSGDFDDLCVSGYRSVLQNPEVQTAINTIADLTATMTIHLMRNTENGDIRIKNELSKKIDINPYSLMTRQTFVHNIVRVMLGEGNGNAYVLPITESGYIRDLKPLEPGQVSAIQEDETYRIRYKGNIYSQDEVLHFVNNPDPEKPWMGMGYRAALSDIANNLKQASATKKGFMSSKYKPPLVVKVDALTDEFSDKEGRKKLLEEYIESSEQGEPWLIPAEQFDIQSIKPLSLTDLALNESVTIDKKTVASILGVPPFVVGAGEFKREEWNNFITTKVMMVARIIEQELTKKLLISPDMFFRMNSRSLYSYELKDIADIAQNLFVRGLLTGNEARDWVNVGPKDGLDDLTILENYIPLDMIGEQKKLNQNGGE